MSEFGTISWAAQSGGHLTTSERLSMALQGVRAVVQSKLPSKAFDGVIEAQRPTTAFTAHAEAVLGSCSPPWLINHGMRTYAWACAFAARDDLKPDRELLYCAALLHDLGITDVYLPPVGECFAQAGAVAALDLLRTQGMPLHRAQIVAEAICLHLNIVVEVSKHGPEAGLLRAATACDVAGQDLGSIQAAFRKHTLAEIPRLDFKREVATAMNLQLARSPATRIGFLCKHLGLVSRVYKAPFES
jgi:hypothetical protein